MIVRNGTHDDGPYATSPMALLAYDRPTVARAIAARLVAAGWRYRRGSSAPWVEPVSTTYELERQERDDLAGYSLLGAAERQAELERATSFERHAR